MEIDLKFTQKIHNKGACEEGFSFSNNQISILRSAIMKSNFQFLVVCEEGCKLSN